MKQSEARAKHMLENEVENYLKNQVFKVCKFSLCEKYTPQNTAGHPDRLIIMPGISATIFVETKRPTGKLRRLQEAVHEKYRKAGAEVYVAHTKEQVDEFIKMLLERMV